MDGFKLVIIGISAVALMGGVSNITSAAHTFAEKVGLVESQDPFRVWIHQIGEKYECFHDNRDFNAKLAELHDFWVQEGISGAKVDYEPPACRGHRA